MSDNKTKPLYNALVFHKLPPGAVLSDQVDKQARLIAEKMAKPTIEDYAEIKRLKEQIVAIEADRKELQRKLYAANVRVAGLQRTIANA